MNNKIIDNFTKEILYYEYQYYITNDKKYYYKSQALKKGLLIIKKFTTKIINSTQLNNIIGIGNGIKTRIDNILQGKSPAYKFPEYDIINKLLSIIGIGYKTVFKLIKDNNIKSMDDFIDKVNNGEIHLNDKIKLGIKYYNKYEINIPRKEIDDIRGYIISILPKKYTIEICGSYRRMKQSSNDIDVLITSDNYNDNELRNIINIMKDNNFIIDDLTNKNYITKYMGFCKYKNNPIRRIDIRYINKESFYYSLLYFTGSDKFNRFLRKLAKSNGYKLNEYGLYKGGKFIHVKSEEDIFKLLKLPYTAPKHR